MCFYFLHVGEDVIFIANDWHTALLPCYLKSMYQSHGIYKNAKVKGCLISVETVAIRLLANSEVAFFEG